ncbi:MAG TPA: FAD-dependent oxidoreductase [Anaeromyxobacter sp.]
MGVTGSPTLLVFKAGRARSERANSAVEESLFLTQFARSVTIVDQFMEFQAEPASVQEALANPKIRVLLGHEPRGFHGETALERLEVEEEELATRERKELRTDGVFVSVGMVPRTDLLAPYVPLAPGATSRRPTRWRRTCRGSTRLATYA